MIDAKKRRFKVISRAVLKRLVVLGCLLIVLGIFGCDMMMMPGKSYKGKVDLSGKELEDLSNTLKRDVVKLADEIGDRNVFTYANLKKAADWLSQSFEAMGYTVNIQSYEVMKHTCQNIEVELVGSPYKDEVIIVGAHYDSAVNCPAANDNGSGIAALLALAERFKDKSPKRTIRFVAFVNEEPPHYYTPDMGSYVYAKACRENNDQIVAMLSLETMGYYSDEKNSQKYPAPFGLFYPDEGNFIGFVGNYRSKKLVKDVVKRFRRLCEFPSEGAALPASIPGVGWSDHWSFWQFDYLGLMVTDTAPFRYPHYHTMDDTPEKIDYKRLAKVVLGLEKVLEELCREEILKY